ncbi:MAG: hypothetical protein U0931_26960 [Vulcanimicrobiota bacterium]
MKMILSLAILWLGSNLAGAESLTSTPRPTVSRASGHWVIVHEPVNRNGREGFKRSESEAQPWNRPTHLEGQTLRWNVKWEPNAPNPPARELKI